MNPWDGASPSARMALAAALLAVDPPGLGGIALRGPAGPLRDQWLALLRRLLPSGSPWLRVPSHAGDAALLGGLDLTATLETGRPVAQQGLLARADAGVLVLPMAERASPGVASQLAAVLDRREVVLAREGLSLRSPARLALLALDEGAADEERLPAALLDRLALHLLAEPAPEGETPPGWHAADIERARSRLPGVTLPESVLQGLCAAALAWGIDSLRAPLMAVHAARAAAALDGQDEVGDTHAALAAALVLAPRATRLPPPATRGDADPPPAAAETGPAPDAQGSKPSRPGPTPARPTTTPPKPMRRRSRPRWKTGWSRPSAPRFRMGCWLRCRPARRARPAPAPPVGWARRASTRTAVARSAAGVPNRAPARACTCWTPCARRRPGSA
jgi:magnesium chelatase subunit D